jgi:uncharacterized tellurite resistance protein B-like protein
VRTCLAVHPQDLVIVKGLVCVAWADGRLAQEERVVLQALLDSFSATPTDRREVEQYSAEQRGIADISCLELDHDARRVLLQHAVLLTFAAGQPGDSEQRLIERLCEALAIPKQEATGLIAQATERAQQHLSLL